MCISIQATELLRKRKRRVRHTGIFHKAFFSIAHLLFVFVLAFGNATNTKNGIPFAKKLSQNHQFQYLIIDRLQLIILGYMYMLVIPAQ